jgi:hypothetical protein
MSLRDLVFGEVAGVLSVATVTVGQEEAFYEQEVAGKLVRHQGGPRGGVCRTSRG